MGRSRARCGRRRPDSSTWNPPCGGAPKTRPWPSALALLRADARPGGFGSADDHPHDFVGSLQDAVHPEIAHDLLQTVLAKIAVAAVQVQRLVGDVETLIGDVPFGHRAQ